jgi:hypothetical protein
MKRSFVYVAALAMLYANSAKAECLVLGDSIAAGVAPYKAACKNVSRVGANSAAIARMAPKGSYSVVYVSAGSNDPLNPKLGENLFAIRRKYPTAKFVWIAPRNSRAAERVYETAIFHHDRVVYTSKLKSNDGLHPKSYSELARKL